MEFKRESGSLSRIAADTLVLGVFQGEGLPKLIAKLDKTFPDDFKKAIAASCSSESFEGKSGQLLSLPTYGKLKVRKLIFWGLGKAGDFVPGSVRKMAANAARRMNSGGAQGTVCLYLR